MRLHHTEYNGDGTIKSDKDSPIIFNFNSDQVIGSIIEVFWYNAEQDNNPSDPSHEMKLEIKFLLDDVEQETFTSISYSSSGNSMRTLAMVTSKVFDQFIIRTPFTNPGVSGKHPVIPEVKINQGNTTVTLITD